MSKQNSPVTFGLVGHCGADTYSITQAVRRAVPEAAIIAVGSQAALAANPNAVLLINRVLDGGFDTDSGVELIRELAARERKPMMMLISNYGDAQDAAVAAGAIRGFGKSELGSVKTAEALRSFAARPAAPAIK